MAMWKYTIQSGKALREAIYDGSTERTIQCLRQCYKELYDKMDKEDKEYYEYDIEDTLDILTNYEEDPYDEDDLNYCLQDFYDICDSARAFITL